MISYSREKRISQKPNDLFIYFLFVSFAEKRFATFRTCREIIVLKVRRAFRGGNHLGYLRERGEIRVSRFVPSRAWIIRLPSGRRTQIIRGLKRVVVVVSQFGSSSSYDCRGSFAFPGGGVFQRDLCEGNPGPVLPHLLPQL